MFIYHYIKRRILFDVTTSGEISRLVDIKHSLKHDPAFNPKSSAPPASGSSQVRHYIDNLNRLIGQSEESLVIIAGIKWHFSKGIAVQRKINALKKIRDQLRNRSELNSSLSADYAQGVRNFREAFESVVDGISVRYLTTLYKCVTDALKAVRTESEKYIITGRVILQSFNIDESARTCYFPLHDFLKIRELFTNLLRNAVDATIAHTEDNNNIKISLSRISDQLFQVIIEDSGIGMDQETLRNFAIDGFSRGKESGTGHGIRKDMINTAEKYGELTADSSTGQGTTITVNVNAQKAEQIYRKERRVVIRRKIEFAGLALLSIIVVTVLYPYMFPDKHFATYQFKTGKKLMWSFENEKYEINPAQEPDTIIFYNSKGQKINSYYTGNHSFFVCSQISQLISLNNLDAYRQEIELDVDYDGHNELLIGTSVDRMNPAGADEIPSRLFCFESDGSVKWERTLATPNIYKNIIHDRHSKLTAVDVRDFNNDGKLEILVTSCRYYYPCQILLLDLNKNILFEYWHPGFLLYLGVRNVDDDPLDEMIFYGINNLEELSAAVVAFDANFKGGQALPYRGASFKPAREDLYLIYKPHPDFKKAWGISDIMLQNIEIVVNTGPIEPPEKGILWQVDMPNGVSFWLNYYLFPQKGQLMRRIDYLYREHWAAVRQRGGIDRDCTPADISLQTDPNYWKVYRKGEFINKVEHESLITSFMNTKKQK